MAWQGMALRLEFRARHVLDLLVLVLTGLRYRERESSVRPAVDATRTDPEAIPAIRSLRCWGFDDLQILCFLVPTWSIRPFSVSSCRLVAPSSCNGILRGFQAPVQTRLCF